MPKKGTQKKLVLQEDTPVSLPENKAGKETKRPSMPKIDVLKPTTEFTKALATEIVKNLTSVGEFATRFRKPKSEKKQSTSQLGDHPVLVDTSVFIDGRIVPIVNSGFFAGSVLVPQFVLAEIQHIADSADPIRRAKGRRGLDVVQKLKNQKVNDMVKTKIIPDDVLDQKEVDHKLVALSRKWKIRMITVDYNLAQLARAQGVKVLNINDLAQAIKVALVPGEEFVIRISHEGKEREQGVGYLEDGTMVVVDNARDKVGIDISVVITKIHHTPAGQLFFARLK